MSKMGIFVTLITQEQIASALDWAYEKSVNGVAGLDSAEELADTYRKGNNDSVYDQANSLIRWQNTKAATSGFVTGLGGGDHLTGCYASEYCQCFIFTDQDDCSYCPHRWL